MFALEVLGPFRLLAPDGVRINVKSKKAQALIAMLAVSGGGERTRSWLQGQLWGSRGQDQAQASLRSEISSLRRLFDASDRPLIDSDHARVWIDLTQISVDARDMQGQTGHAGEFLEGLDIAGEEGFEEWLRDERARLESQREAASSSPASKGAASSAATAEFSVRPAIAVLPFVNQTGDAAQDFRAEGLSEDLIDRLSRLRWLPVIARSSSFTVREPNPDPKSVGAALGARYLLEGRLRSEQGAVVLAASLADTQTGEVVWSNRLALADDSPTALEDLLTGMTSTLGAKIDQQEQSLTLRKPQSDLNVRELIWRGRWHMNRFTREDSEQAMACFDEALDREPNSPEALIQRTWALLWAAWARRATDEETRTIRRLAQAAIIADYDDARGHMLAGIAETWLRQPMRAEALLRQAIELNPSLVQAHAQLGDVLLLRGEPEAGIKSLRLAIRLSPNDQHLFFFHGELAVACLMQGNYEVALGHAEASINRRAAYWFAHVMRINALVRLDRVDEARAAYAELHMSKSGFEAEYIDWIPFMESRWNDFLKEGLNLASGQSD